MRTFSIASAAATALAGAAFFASVVTADLDPIIIKVRHHDNIFCAEESMLKH
jgi:hypothetical protein